MSRTSATVRWKRSDEGHAESHCGRFTIHPLYMGCTSPQGYELWDKLAPKGRVAEGDTQATVKREAQRIADRGTA